MNNAPKITNVSCLLALGLSLSSCEHLGPKHNQLLPLEPIKAQNAKDAEVFKDLQNKPTNSTVRPPAEIYKGTDRYIAPSGGSGKVTPKTGSYTMDFDDTDLADVAYVVFHDVLKQSYVINPKVVGKVTVHTKEQLTDDEMLSTFETLLRMNGAALVKQGTVYHIEPAADTLYNSDITSGGSNAGQVGYQTRIIPVRNVSVTEIAEVIKPLVQEKTILHVDSTRNILVASGTADEMSRVMDLVSTFDIDVLKGRSFGLFPLVHSDPEDVAKELEEIFVGKKGKEESEFFHFMPLERLNAVLAVTHQGRYLQDIESWVLRLDKPNTASGGGVNVYKVQHADAEELADTLNEIFTGAQHQDRSAKVSPGQKSTELSNKNSGSNNSSNPNSSTNSATGSGSSSSASSKRSKKSTGRSTGSASTGTATVANVDDVRIISDKTNNALIIVATPREYEVILPVIKQLDILPLQVLIDATIVSVTLQDDLKYGIQWFLDHQGSSISSGVTKASQLGSVGTAATDAFATGGLSAVYNSGVISALLSSVAAKNNLNVISSPSLMVLNNQEATIEVGDQIPILSSSLSGVSSASTSGLVTSNSIQYKDTGVTLNVTPRVNANGMVIMDIKQTVSDPKTTTVSGIDSATISQKKIESSVAVVDGETIVLGGLIKEENTFNKSGIPFLNQLPWVGPLFGTTTNNKDKTELVVLITPRVVKSKHDSRLISTEFRRKLTGIYRQ
ncbi:type II secretion system secretin GspD [Methylovulum psychrotolerans]|uniref:Type II secretion system protein GspD n=1 Tax=Methylovulum psychrotolerans TaxID=1704499 RepID=A0A2S5CRV9_9GAMM|nr:type II secretion system secretin GspD [Methylovulum psychrotolerans]POZ53516.1 type II secretion system protein GspD [Methylovulum psychrotolerans]